MRAAIEQANATPGADTINFNIPDDPNVPDFEVKTISPASKLPEITKAVTIDGYSQPGSKKNTKQVGSDALLNIEVVGTFAGDGANGLVINANSVVVRGLVINRFGDHGIEILPPGGGAARNNIVEGNFIGTDPAGTEDLGNGTDGVFVEVEATDNLIGGRDAAAATSSAATKATAWCFSTARTAWRTATSAPMPPALKTSATVGRG